MQQCNSASTCVRLRQLWTNQMQGIFGLGALSRTPNCQICKCTRDLGPTVHTGDPKVYGQCWGLGRPTESNSIGWKYWDPIWAMMAHLGSRTHFTSFGLWYQDPNAMLKVYVAILGQSPYKVEDECVGIKIRIRISNLRLWGWTIVRMVRAWAVQIIGARVLMKKREAAVQLRNRSCANLSSQLSRFCDQGKGDVNWLFNGVIHYNIVKGESWGIPHVHILRCWPIFPSGTVTHQK